MPTERINERGVVAACPCRLQCFAATAEICVREVTGEIVAEQGARRPVIRTDGKRRPAEPPSPRPFGRSRRAALRPQSAASAQGGSDWHSRGALPGLLQHTGARSGLFSARSAHRRRKAPTLQAPAYRLYAVGQAPGLVRQIPPRPPSPPRSNPPLKRLRPPPP